jgi:hypothetical protein
MSIKIQFPRATGSNAAYGPKRRIHSKSVPDFAKFTMYVQEMMKGNYDPAKEYLQLEYNVDSEWCVIDSDETYQCALAEFAEVLQITVRLEELNSPTASTHLVGGSDKNKVLVQDCSSVEKTNSRNELVPALTVTVSAERMSKAIDQALSTFQPSNVAASADNTVVSKVCDKVSDKESSTQLLPAASLQPTSVPQPKFQIGQHVYSKCNIPNCNTYIISEYFYPGIVEAYDAEKRSYTVFFPNDYDRASGLQEGHLRSIDVVGFDIYALVKPKDDHKDEKCTVFRIVRFKEQLGLVTLKDASKCLCPAKGETPLHVKAEKLTMVQSNQVYPTGTLVYSSEAQLFLPMLVLSYNSQEQMYSLINPTCVAQLAEGNVKLQHITSSEVYGQQLPALTQLNIREAAKKVFDRFCSPNLSPTLLWNIENWIQFYYNNISKSCPGSQHCQVIADQFDSKAVSRYTVSGSARPTSPSVWNEQVLTLQSFIEYWLRCPRTKAWQWLFAQGFNTQFLHKERQFRKGEIVYARDTLSGPNPDMVEWRVEGVFDNTLELVPLQTHVNGVLYLPFATSKQFVSQKVSGCHHCAQQRYDEKLATHIVCICNGKRFVALLHD